MKVGFILFLICKSKQEFQMDMFLLFMLVICFSFGDAFESGERSRCYNDLLNPARLKPTNVSVVCKFILIQEHDWMLIFLALSRNGYKNEVELFNATTYAGDTSLEAVCYCRSNHDPIFFLAPNPETPGDTISAFCTVGDDSFTSLEIHDEAELFDTLLFKRFNTVSKSVMDPLPKNLNGSVALNGVVCNDYYGYPTVSLYIPLKVAPLYIDIFRSRIRVNKHVSWSSSFRKQLVTFMLAHSKLMRLL